MDIEQWSMYPMSGESAVIDSAGKAPTADEQQTVQEQQMDMAVEGFKKSEDKKRANRAGLSRAIGRMIAVDGQALNGVSVDNMEMLARQNWLAKTIDRLSKAPTALDFQKEVGNSIGKLYEEFREIEGAPNRIGFKGTSQEALSAASRMVEANPSGEAWWGIVADHDPVSELTEKMRMSREIKLARRTAKLAVEGFGKPEAGLAMQKTRLMERFGFNEVVFEGAPKTPAEQSLLLDKIEKTLAAGAKDLGLSTESSVGMSGDWSLRLMDAYAHEMLLNRGAYVQTGKANILALPPEAADTGFFKHEWTHMLDDRLGGQLKKMVLEDPTVDAVTKHLVEGEVFFSKMPKRAQLRMPEAYKGYWEVAAAGQGMAEGFWLREVDAERLKKLEDVSARIESRLLQKPELMLALTNEQREDLSGSVKGGLKFLLTSKELSAQAVLSQGPVDFDFNKAKLGSFADASKVAEAMKVVAGALEEKFGAKWRTGPDGVPIDAMESLGKTLNGIVAGSESSELREIAKMRGSNDVPLNPQGKFSQASRVMDAKRGAEGYMDSPHEMLARTVGRPKDFSARVESAARVLNAINDFGGAGFGNDDEIFRNSYAPELDRRGQRQVSEGFSKMVEAAGLGQAKMRTGPREYIEMAMLSKPGAALMDAAASVIESINRAEVSVNYHAGSLYKAVIGGAWSKIEAVERKIAGSGSWVKGIGALAAFGAYSSGEQALEAAKRAEVGKASVAAVESAAGAVVVGGSVAQVAGIARAAPLMKAAGPVGAVLGFTSAFNSAMEAIVESKEGKEAESERHWKGAGIRAAGAAGSLAAGMATGAAIGSALPVVGTIAGAAVGVGIAYGADKWSEAVEKASVPKIVDIGSKLAVKRACEGHEVALSRAPKMGAAR